MFFEGFSTLEIQLFVWPSKAALKIIYSFNASVCVKL